VIGLALASSLRGREEAQLDKAAEKSLRREGLESRSRMGCPGTGGKKKWKKPDEVTGEPVKKRSRDLKADPGKQKEKRPPSGAPPSKTRRRFGEKSI